MLRRVGHVRFTARLMKSGFEQTRRVRRHSSRGPQIHRFVAGTHTALCARMHKLYADDRGEVTIEELGESGVLAHVKGYMTLAMASAIVKRFEELLSVRGQLSIAHDWYEMSNYAGEARVALTEFSTKNRSKIASAHILVKSAMVNMGVNTASIALKAFGLTLTSTTDRAVFEERIKAFGPPKQGRKAA